MSNGFAVPAHRHLRVGACIIGLGGLLAVAGAGSAAAGPPNSKGVVSSGGSAAAAPVTSSYDAPRVIPGTGRKVG